MKKSTIIPLAGAFLVFFFSAASLFGQDLKLEPGDLEITQSLDGGYHLYIRQTGGIRSVLLTESTRDPAGTADSFALRAETYNPVNGDERRILNGEFLDPAGGLYSLIDSTPEPHPRLGQAFHIFIPYIVIYGYPWSRAGEIMVLDGTWLNIRTFGAPYGDYTGGFADNPFQLKVVQKIKESPPEIPHGVFMDETVKAYGEIAREGRGEVIYSRGREDLLVKIREIIEEVPGRTLDLVLALDTTESMTDDWPFLRANLVSQLEEITRDFDILRVGIVFYKDYYESFLTRIVPFQSGLGGIQKQLDSIRPFGGRDIPEAVYEALHAGLLGFPWESENRMIVLVGDAPPHPRPRGEITKEMVFAEAERLGVAINPIILPQ